MVINFSLLRLFIIFVLVILFPLVQKQWLNLYLFNINNFTIYKILYYLSGITVPLLVVINSLNKFTYYKFNYHNKENKNYISGKLLLTLTFIISALLSVLVSRYVFINLKIILNLFLSNNDNLLRFDVDKQILFLVIITTFLIFKKTKFFLKKIILLNFFILSIITWYSQFNNYFLIDLLPFSIVKFENINFLNLVFLLSIETAFYLWSYVSYSSYLSDWNVPNPHRQDILPILNIVMFYLLIILYYSILFN